MTVLDARQEIMREYHLAMLDVAYREIYGEPAKAVAGVPKRYPNPSETELDILRAELVETFNRYRPIGGWAYPGGESAGDGDWQRLPESPEGIIKYIDARARAEIEEVVKSVRRDAIKLDKPTSNTDTTTKGAEK